MTAAIPLRKWTERSFSFGYDAEFIPYLVERLSATAPRMEELVAGVSDESLSARRGNKWSVKEQVGHLIDLEALHDGRLDDFRNGVEVLRAADMTNQKTEEAVHNSRSISSLITQFRSVRSAFFQKLHSLDTTALQHKALHPRLKQMVNVADILYFVAEHDTHHLAHMAALLDPDV